MVSQVLDGDSFRAQIEGTEHEVRLLGINTPERGECFDRPARDQARLLLAGQSVTLVSGDEDRDQFDRLLRYVFLADGTHVNLRLVEAGAGLALSGEHPRLAEFKAAEVTAFANRQGRWAETACGPATTARISIVELLFDADGPDGDNPNGEWIVIQNQGSDPIALSGWTLRDESSQHRFTFEDSTLGPGTEIRIRSGCGEDTEDDLYWCAADAVWSNGGDTAYLADPSGNVVARRGY